MPRSAEQSERTTVQAVRAFTLIELLVSIGVVAVLISLLLPTIGAVHQASERVVCSSNVRQMGLGTVMYADANDGQLPHTRFIALAADGGVLDQETVIVRLGQDSPRSRWSFANEFGVEDQLNWWDGMGLLYSQEYLSSPGVYYCPSHFGEHDLAKYSPDWGAERGEIVSNYQYRGMGANLETDLYKIDPRTSSLVADAFRTELDFNHESGANVLRADMAVFWFESSFSELLARLPDDGDSTAAVTSGPTGDLSSIWSQFDSLAPSMGRPRSTDPANTDG